MDNGLKENVQQHTAAHYYSAKTKGADAVSHRLRAQVQYSFLHIGTMLLFRR